MSTNPSEKRKRAFQFHALVTVDESDTPYGVATTDAHAVLPGEYLYEDFSCVSRPGFSVAQISFEIDVPEDMMIDRRPTIKARLVTTEAPDGLDGVVERQVEPQLLPREIDELEDAIQLPSILDIQSAAILEADDYDAELDDMFDGIANDADEFDEAFDDSGERVDSDEVLQSTNPPEKDKKSCVTQDLDEIDINVRWLEDSPDGK